MLEIILIRHGQTDWNRDRRIMGHRPVPLNPRGRVARHLKKIPLDAIFTSPMLRAVETAEFLIGERGLKIRLTADLAEIDYGLWVGKTFDEVMEEEAYTVYHRTPRHAHPPGGEKMTEVRRRAVGFIEGLRGKYQKGRIAVVSHADVIKTILVHYLGMDLNYLQKFRIDNTSLSLLWFQKNISRVMAVNCPTVPKKLFSPTDQVHAKVVRRGGPRKGPR